MNVSFDDEFDVLVGAFNFHGGQYKKIGDKTFYKFCKTLYLDKFKEPYSRFYDASSFKVPHKTCPFPAGQNEITNLMFSENGLLPPYVPGGEKWRIDVRFVKNNEILGGLNMYGLLRNEQSLLRGG